MCRRLLPVIAAASLLATAAVVVIGHPRAVEASGYSAVVLGDQPTGYWRLDEASGATAADSSGNGYSGAITAGVTYGVPGALTTDGDTAMGFSNALGGYVTTSLTPGNWPAMSVEGWVKQTSSANANDQIMATRNAGTNTGFELYSGAAGSPQINWCLDTSVSGIHCFPSSYSTSLNTWYDVVITYDGSYDREYINGVQQGTGYAQTGNVVSSGLPLQLGRCGLSSCNTPPYIWDGTLDELAIYQTALSPSQVLNHYMAGIGQSAGEPINATMLSGSLSLVAPATLAIPSTVPGANTGAADPRHARHPGHARRCNQPDRGRGPHRSRHRFELSRHA